MPTWFSSELIDVAIVLVVIYYAYNGYRRGFILVALELIGFFAALFAALALYGFFGNLLASHVAMPRTFARVIAFFVIWAGVEMLYPLAASVAYKKIPAKFRASGVNHALGPVPAIMDGLLIIALLLSMSVALPLPGPIKKEVVDSRVGGFLVARTEGFAGAIDQVFGGAVKDTLTFLTIKPGHDETIELGFKTDEVTPDPEAEQEMFAMVNKERVENGLKALAWDEKIVPVARAHAVDMFSRGYFSHETPEGLSPADRADAAGVRYQVWGENLAYAPDVSIAHSGLMNSPGHRANILSTEFRRIGIGVLDGGIYGMMFVQNFAW